LTGAAVNRRIFRAGRGNRRKTRQLYALAARIQKASALRLTKNNEEPHDFTFHSPTFHFDFADRFGPDTGGL
jgi:hypothetical protein